MIPRLKAIKPESLVLRVVTGNETFAKDHQVYRSTVLLFLLHTLMSTHEDALCSAH